MITSILVATDFSPAADAAVAQAARIAHATNAALGIIHIPANDPSEELAAFFPDAGDFGTKQTENAIRERMSTRLESLGINAGDTPPEVIVRRGHPVKCILDAIAERKADLLVMGATGVAQHRLGTVGGKCVRKSPVNTLLIPEGCTDAFAHITACVDFSELSPQVVDSAATLARPDGSALTALYAHEKVDQSVFVQGPPQELIDRLPSVIEERFEKELAKHAGDTPVSFTVSVCKSYSEGIVRHANESKTDLVVVGTTGRSGIAYLLLGTTAEKVIREVGCAVLAVKKPKG